MSESARSLSCILERRKNQPRDALGADAFAEGVWRPAKPGVKPGSGLRPCGQKMRMAKTAEGVAVS